MKELTVDAVLENIPSVTAFIDGQLEALDCSMKAQMQIDVAIDELFSNIARYAYPDGPGKATVGIEFDEENRMCSVVFSDEGIPFDPLAQQAPDTSLPLMDRPVGGLGIFLVKKTMDAMAYEYKFSQNVLTIEKKLS